MVRIKIWPFAWSLLFVALTLLQFFILFGFAAWPFAVALFLFEIIWILQIVKGRLFLFPIGISFLAAIGTVAWVEKVIQREVIQVFIGLTIFSALFWVISRMGLMLSRAYSRPFRRWFEGVWSSIQGINGSLDGAFELPLQIQFHRIDIHGAWVFALLPEIKRSDQRFNAIVGKKLLLNWSDGKKDIQPIQVKVVSFQEISGYYAFGLQFLYEDGYHERRITQWIESWEGEARCGIWVCPKPWFEYWF